MCDNAVCNDVRRFPVTGAVMGAAFSKLRLSFDSRGFILTHARGSQLGLGSPREGHELMIVHRSRRR
jgi:hypothetical protein